MSWLPLTTPQVEDGILSISLKDSLHSEISSSMMFIVTDVDVMLAAIVTLVVSLYNPLHL